MCEMRGIDKVREWVSVMRRSLSGVGDSKGKGGLRAATRLVSVAYMAEFVAAACIDGLVESRWAL